MAALAILSMTLGNVIALAQRDIKRLLAYSGIAQMGYVLIALAVFGRNALAAIIVFFFAYLASNAGAFAAVAALYKDETKPHPAPYRTAAETSPALRHRLARSPCALDRRHPSRARAHRHAARAIVQAAMNS